MANAFNFVLRGVIFQELCVACGDILELILFVHAFYAFELPLFYIHHNHESDVIIIPFVKGTYQGDPLGKILFALTHFRALHL
jgi:hypothetical protein